nr:RNA-directed DNA polymerase, eukaryota, nucleotide-binding alpha-beta plait domain protein [Tanacetum cinerariifolium]
MNFPNHFTARDLWNVCLAYGNVIDVYIPFKKSKAGKKFAFVRFTRVDNLEHLIENLCTIWIGRFHLHANVIRFQRESKFDAPQPNAAQPINNASNGVVKNSFATVLKSCNTNPNSAIDSSPAIVLDDSSITDRDLSFFMMRKIKDINAMSNLYFILANESFENVNLSYLGGMWVLMEMDSIESKEKISKHVGVGSWFYEIKPACNSFVTDETKVWISVEGLTIKAYTRNTFAKIVSPWGKLSELEADDNLSLPYKKLYVITRPNVIINDKIKVFVKGRVYWIRVKELDAWTPEFSNDLNDNSSSDGPSIRYSRGVLCVWDSNMFVKESVTISDSFVAIRGTWVSTSTKLIIIFVYAPQDVSERRTLWEYISIMIDSWEGANAFNYFISMASLVDLSLEGYSYTWSHKSALKMCKLDRISLDAQFPKRISSDQNEDLKRNVTYDEIKYTVWDCGVIHRSLPLFLRRKMLSDVQSAFVNNIQILDGILFINELISWCKIKKTTATIFKVEFEKAFDSVKYLDDILNKFGFGVKWRNWIQGYLNSAMRSILVNGSPTSEFKFHKGLKQGDPLSPFLFILVMESPHLSFNNILNAGLYKGIQIDDFLTLSHLFYADDAVFIGKWDKSNINTIVSVLICFFLSAGLKINLHKSNLMGINILK